MEIQIIKSMSLSKQLKDKIIKFMLGSYSVPAGLSELNHYFRIYAPITFSFEKQEDGTYVAISQNYKYGSIITSATELNQLDEKIKDAILTAFEVPSSYSKEADLRKIESQGYAYA